MHGIALPEGLAGRLIGLEGARNFRDFGGYAVSGGGRIRRGRLYRSNRLSKLTAADLDRLATLDVTTIFDLRARREREADPTVWTDPASITHVFRPGHKRRLVDMALDYPPTAAGAQALMHDFYAEMPTAMGETFGAIIRHVADGAAPCVIHCSAGKDRTGVAVALLLAALGVDRAEIAVDYAFTSAIPGRQAGDMARAVVRTGGDEEFRRRYPPEAIAAMMAADPGYIAAAFDAVARGHGTISAYLASIGVDDEVVARLRARLVEQD
ncbi:tyrosine-protein phosphatase [Sphingomonas sanxanigenens]|uniref:Tyrosine specific protein phosphatases domain-containing protein n=1 Tax=Sphingomonas sanxanigenens DSM 19645 = NX02 TaxID=1123269 RepID=W0AG44_9SPHN|nr:tyrosine-protein phosphatase [Sphingomonas sanxanigenens]AHE55492.1 hypothetical protein NX02_19140 [Sphingomonas sanxanigenens DSM 19645 = NX02]